MKALILHKSENKIAVIAAIPFNNIIHSVQFTSREFSTWSEKGQVDRQFDLFYQRPINNERLKSIKKYISETIFSNENDEILFPTSILLGIDLIDDLKIDDDGLFELDSLLNRDDILIIDGQHRMKALQELYNDIGWEGNDKKLKTIRNLKLNCTLLINYDIWDQAKIFANVNFKQKPVEKSLYYDIFGEFYDEKKSNNTLYIAHQLGKFLNTSPKSPLKGFVKDFNTRNGFVSQAFITSSLLNLLSPRGPWNYISEKFNHDASYQTKVPNIIVGYFNVIREQFNKYWPHDLMNQNSTILSKTNALGALIKLLGLLDDRLKKGLVPDFPEIDLIEKSQQEIEAVFNKVFSKFDKNDTNHESNTLKEQLFGKDSKYRGGGSAGLQSQLYKEMAKIIGIPVDKR